MSTETPKIHGSLSPRGRKIKMDIPVMDLTQAKYANVALHSVKSASLESGYTTDTIYQWIKKGKLEACNFRGHVMILADASLPPKESIHSKG